jgi:hypothetical protein
MADPGRELALPFQHGRQNVLLPPVEWQQDLDELAQHPLLVARLEGDSDPVRGEQVRKTQRRTVSGVSS